VNSNDSKPTLTYCLAEAATQKVVKTWLFRGPYVTLGTYLALCAGLYETTALLGRAFRDRLLALEKMLGRPPQRGQLIETLKKMAKDRRARFPGHPKSFYEYFSQTELPKFSHSVSPLHPDSTNALKEKLPIKKIWLFIEMWTSEGFAFGALFPDLTEQMYRNAHENIDRELWQQARTAGLSLAESPPNVTLEDQELKMLTTVSAFAGEYYPELLKPLGLLAH
jgi:hypothetical protein